MATKNKKESLSQAQYDALLEILSDETLANEKWSKVIHRPKYYEVLVENVTPLQKKSIQNKRYYLLRSPEALRKATLDYLRQSTIDQQQDQQEQEQRNLPHPRNLEDDSFASTNMSNSKYDAYVQLQVDRPNAFSVMFTKCESTWKNTTWTRLRLILPLLNWQDVRMTKARLDENGEGLEVKMPPLTYLLKDSQYAQRINVQIAKTDALPDKLTNDQALAAACLQSERAHTALCNAVADGTDGMDDFVTVYFKFPTGVICSNKGFNPDVAATEEFVLTKKAWGIRDPPHGGPGGTTAADLPGVAFEMSIYGEKGKDITKVKTVVDETANLFDDLNLTATSAAHTPRPAAPVAPPAAPTPPPTVPAPVVAAPAAPPAPAAAAQPALTPTQAPLPESPPEMMDVSTGSSEWWSLNASTPAPAAQSRPRVQPGWKRDSTVKKNDKKKTKHDKTKQILEKFRPKEDEYSNIYE